MADSNITKKALANAMKELVAQMPFEKITVADICTKCEMHRKSFYYHFQDKYDLVNWIFDAEITAVVQHQDVVPTTQQRWAFFEQACNYFYENREFYRKALQVRGQNSLGEHMQEYLRILLQKQLSYIWGDDVIDDFILQFFADAILLCILQWLLEKDCMPPEVLVSKLQTIVKLNEKRILLEAQEL